MEALVKLWSAAGDFACACLDGLGLECSDRDLPGLRRGKHALADQLVDRADADAEPDRGGVGADYSGRGIVNLSRGVMLLRSVARWLGAGKLLARL